MKTIYNYNYNYTNLCTMLIIIFLLCVFIAIMFFFSPLLKLSYNLIKASLSQTLEIQFPNIKKSEASVTIIFSLVLYLFLFVVVILFSIFLYNSKFEWIDTNISTCDIVNGTCENFSYQKFESRDYFVYTCDFTVNDVDFSEVEIRQSVSDEDIIQYLTKDYNFNIYYRKIKSKNRIVRIDALTQG